VTMGKSRVLVVGATGDLGKYLVKASIEQGHPTFLLVRQGAAPTGAKKELLDSFTAQGAVALHGDLDDQASLVAALKQVDVVISVLGSSALLDGQLKLIEAIKKVGHIKRFLPSEFGSDMDLPNDYAPALLEPVFAPKRAIRKALRESGIPHTFVCNSAFSEFIISPLAQVDILLSGDLKPPQQNITIFGSGEGKLVTVTQEDIGKVSLKAVDDPRTLNKQLVIRPPPNVLTFNSLVALWEKKLGHSLNKTYVSEAEVEKQIEGLSVPANLFQALYLNLTSGHDVFPLGPGDVDANELYPDFKYVTVDEFLDRFVEKK